MSRFIIKDMPRHTMYNLGNEQEGCIVRFLLVCIGILLIAAACSSSESDTPTTTEPTAASATVDRLRQMAFDYWEAFNSFEADKVLAFLEDTYRLEREEEIRTDIGRIKTFGVRLEVSEQIPPQVDGDKAVMFLLMKEPLGIRRIQMSYLKVDGDWKLTYSEEAEE